MDDGRLNELGSITSGAIHAESSVSFTHASLSGSMQQLIDDINAKRKEDDHLVENYKKASEMHVRFGVIISVLFNKCCHDPSLTFCGPCNYLFSYLLYMVQIRVVALIMSYHEWLIIDNIV